MSKQADNTKIALKNLHEKVRHHYFIGLAVVMGLIVVVYVFLIKAVPGFITDDYYIFYLINKEPSSLFVHNPAEKFYLFYRPISYLYFRFLYALFGSDPILMKAATLALLLVAIFLLMGITDRFASYFRKEVSIFGSLLIPFFVAFHPDIIESVLWISDANELLMVTFYLLALYIVSGILLGKYRPNFGSIVIAVLAFVLSVLSKQQSLHFPLLLGAFLLWKGKEIEQDKRRALWIIAGITLGIMAVILWSNVTLYLTRDSSENLFMVIWKKPFALAGTLLYILFPLYGLEIYSYFLMHKIVAITVSIFCVLICYVLIRKKYIPFKTITVYSLVIVIIFFPRIFLPASDRINVLQVFCIGTMFFAAITGNKVKMIRFSAVLIVCSLLAGSIAFQKYRSETDYANKMNFDLEQFLSHQQGKTFVLAYYLPISTTQNSLYYVKNNKFGVDSTILYSGVVVRNSLTSFIKPTGFYSTVRKDTIEVYSSGPNVEIYIDNNTKAPTIIDSTYGVRGFSFLRYVLHPDVSQKSRNMIVYTDSGWVKLN